MLELWENPRARGRVTETLIRGARAIFQPKNRPHELHGEDIKITKTISFQDSYLGSEVRVEYERLVRCVKCQGSGRQHPEECPLCQGRGKIVFPGAGMMTKLCPRCSGTGLVGKTPCRPCHGQGRRREAATTQLRVPPGARTGLQLRAAGHGNEGLRGGKDGDLLLSLEVAGALDFQRRELDLYTEKMVPLDLAVRGGKAAVSLPDGSAIEIDIPAGSAPGREIRIIGRGFRSIPDGKKGDLIVQLDIYIPGDLNDHLRDLGRAWLDAIGAEAPERAAAIAAELSTDIEGRTS